MEKNALNWIERNKLFVGLLIAGIVSAAALLTSAFLLPDPREGPLLGQSIENYRPPGVRVSATPSSMRDLKGYSNPKRIWTFTASDGGAAFAAGRQVLDAASSDGWTVESSETYKGSVPKWVGRAAKRTDSGTLRLEVRAENRDGMRDPTSVVYVVTELEQR